ncbi:MAG: lipoprotein-releasing ABC transporter permease subunit [Gammaproteobacteria bacterium]|nr:lipoprotein-releasing ABC transporter permease subunit [Gammaproteobacteria bacterium]
MFKPLPIYIGYRYTRSKGRNHFVSFMSLVSMLGIALGVAVLITVLSVMNGFDYQIKHHIFNMADQVVISSDSGIISDWHKLSEKVKKVKDIVASAPFIDQQAMLSANGVVRGVMLRGVSPKEEAKVSIIGKKMIAGHMSSLQSGKFSIIIGDELAENLGLMVGDTVIVVAPQANFTPIGIIPRYRRFTVTGIFHVGSGFGFDNGVGLINMKDTQKLFEMGQHVTGLRLKINRLYDAPQVSYELQKILSSNYVVSNWTGRYSTYFKAIRMEKTMMFVILMFIIAVAAFNLVSGLVMNVTDKKADIAILRTMGASPRVIMFIFVVQGAIVGLIGTIFGIIGGILLAWKAPQIVKFLEQILHTHFISASVYFIDYLPSRLDFSDVLHVALIAMFLSLLATIYPALRAAKMEVAEALRYE